MRKHFFPNNEHRQENNRVRTDCSPMSGTPEANAVFSISLSNCILASNKCAILSTAIINIKTRKYNLIQKRRLLEYSFHINF